MPEQEQEQEQLTDKDKEKDARHQRQIERLQTRRDQDKQRSSAMTGGAIVLGVIVLAGAIMVGINSFKPGAAPTITQTTQSTPDYSYGSNNPFDVGYGGKLAVPQQAKDLAGWVGGTMLGIGGCLFLYSRVTRRKYIMFDKIGILISDSPKNGHGDARFIPWGCLYSVDVVYPELKNTEISDNETVKLIRHQLKSDDPQVVFYVDDGSTVRLNWRDVVACTEAGAFINALKTWSPDAIGACKFPGEGDLGKIDSNNYTQLWFKYYSQASDRKRTMHLIQGDTLQEGRYTVAGRLGSGGQGTAYLAVDNRATAPMPTDVVLKEYILPVHRGQQVLEQTVDKLKKEADILRSIDHPNIVRMLGEFVEDHRGYLIMEYVQGRPLKSLVVEEGKLPEKTVKDIAMQICDILEYLHGKSPPIIHRDLTPDNLILQDDGVVKLVDFNVAHQLESAATATVVGKHCYIPPEQFRGKPTTGSDLYAFGCTLFFLLTGEEPEPLSVSRPRDKNEAVSEELNYVVATCTSLDAKKRFTNATELKEALLSIDADKGAKIKLNDRIEA